MHVTDEVSREQFEELRDQVASSRKDIDALQADGHVSRARADASEVRADTPNRISPVGGAVLMSRDRRMLLVEGRCSP